PSFFPNDTAPPHIYPLSLHDALPISTRWPAAARAWAIPLPIRPVPTSATVVIAGSFRLVQPAANRVDDPVDGRQRGVLERRRRRDRKSTRLNSSHDQISYAVFCLKKK